MILGGTGSQGTIEASAERFDPQTRRFQTVPVPVEPRAFHSATLLTEGRLLIVGGVGPDGQVRASAEVWDPASATVADPIAMRAPRRGHTATLLDDGSIAIVGGMGGDGQPAVASEIYYPATESFAVGVSAPMAPDVTFLAGSRPEPAITPRSPASRRGRCDELSGFLLSNGRGRQEGCPSRL